MKPAYRIVANDKDITSMIADRLVELSIIDEAGVKSDRLTLELDDRDQLFALPAKDAELRVSIGYEGSPLVEVGVYVVDEIEVTGGPATLTIRACATNFNGAISAQKERSWHGTTLGDIARKIASEHSLEPVITKAAGAIKVKHVDQNESDIQFLTRLATQNNCVVKTPEKKLVLAERGRSKAASGQPLPVITIEPSQGASWSMTTTGRGTYAAVKAYWHDKGKAKRTAVTAGATDKKARTLSLTQTYASEAEAKEAAQSKLEALEKGESTLQVKDIPGNPNIFAEQPVVAQGFRSGVDGNWVVTKVEHKISGGGGGFTTNVDCELPGAKKEES